MIKPHLTEVKRGSQLAAINEFRRKFVKCLADASFLVFNGNNLLFPEIQLLALVSQAITRFPFPFHQIMGN